MRESVFLEVLNRSISAGWLILAVLLLRPLIKKAPKWICVLLWGLVAVRLICPVTIESAVSLIPSTETFPQEILLDPSPKIDSGVTVLNEIVNPVIADTSTPNMAASVNPLQITALIAQIVWIIGMAGMILYALISCIRLRLRVAEAIPAEPGVYHCERITFPFVLGMIRPGIYLPLHLTEEDRTAILRHERAHIKRKDHWWKLLGFVLLTVHWFHPLFWVAYILLCRDIELACDEKVIRELDDEQRANYSQALLNCSTKQRNMAVCPLAFGEVGVKQRIKHVLHYKKPAFWVLVAALAVCAVTAVCFLTDPAEKQSSDSISETGGVDTPELISEEERTELNPEEAENGSLENITEPEEIKKPYLRFYYLDENGTEASSDYPLTEEQFTEILQEERKELPAGTGFAATLEYQTETGDETEYYTEAKGVSPTVLALGLEVCDYRLESPKDMSGNIISAVLECNWLDKPLTAEKEDLPRLEEILRNARQQGVGACGYGAKLTITLSDGKEMILFKGTDGCDSMVFGSFGGYVIGDQENTEFWEFFGLDPDPSVRLGI